MNVVLNQEFRLFRCYQVPQFTEAHINTLSTLLAQYLFIKYAGANGSARYTKAEDINVKTDFATTTQDEVQMSHITLKHALGTQIMVFIEHADRHIALIKSSTPLFLVQALESLTFDTPLILSPLHVSTSAFARCFNEYEAILAAGPSSLGDVEFTFAPSKPLTDNSLKEFIVEIPARDLKELVTNIGTSSTAMEQVFGWLTKSTTLRFENLETKGLRCALVALSMERLKFASTISEDILPKLLAATINGVSAD